MTADQLIPASVVDILTFADQYSTPENVEYFLRWDVSDIFYNYFFIGNYISVGGAAFILRVAVYDKCIRHRHALCRELLIDIELLPAVEYEEGTGELDVTPETQQTPQS